MVSKGKGGKRGPKQQQDEGQKVSQNKFQVLEENEEIKKENHSMEESHKAKEKE